MNLRLNRPILGLTLLVAACAPRPPAAGSLSEQDISALRAIADRDAPIVLARDWDTLTAEYAVDAVRMPPNAPAVQGRDAIRRFIDGYPPISEFTFRLIDLKGDGQLAYMHGAWTITFTPLGAAMPISDSGKILVVLRKQADGTWLRVADAWNSDVAPPQ